MVFFAPLFFFFFFFFFFFLKLFIPHERPPLFSSLASPIYHVKYINQVDICQLCEVLRDDVKSTTGCLITSLQPTSPLGTTREVSSLPAILSRTSKNGIYLLSRSLFSQTNRSELIEVLLQ